MLKSRFSFFKNRLKNKSDIKILSVLCDITISHDINDVVIYNTLQHGVEINSGTELYCSEKSKESNINSNELDYYYNNGVICLRGIDNRIVTIFETANLEPGYLLIQTNKKIYKVSIKEIDITPYTVNFYLNVLDIFNVHPEILYDMLNKFPHLNFVNLFAAHNTLYPTLCNMIKFKIDKKLAESTIDNNSILFRSVSPIVIFMSQLYNTKNVERFKYLFTSILIDNIKTNNNLYDIALNGLKWLLLAVETMLITNEIIHLIKAMYDVLSKYKIDYMKYIASFFFLRIISPALTQHDISETPKIRSLTTKPKQKDDNMKRKLSLNLESITLANDLNIITKKSPVTSTESDHESMISSTSSEQLSSDRTKFKTSKNSPTSSNSNKNSPKRLSISSNSPISDETSKSPKNLSHLMSKDIPIFATRRKRSTNNTSESMIKTSASTSSLSSYLIPTATTQIHMEQDLSNSDIKKRLLVIAKIYQCLANKTLPNNDTLQNDTSRNQIYDTIIKLFDQIYLIDFMINKIVNQPLVNIQVDSFILHDLSEVYDELLKILAQSSLAQSSPEQVSSNDIQQNKYREKYKEIINKYGQSVDITKIYKIETYLRSQMLIM